MQITPFVGRARTGAKEAYIGLCSSLEFTVPNWILVLIIGENYTSKANKPFATSYIKYSRAESFIFVSDERIFFKARATPQNSHRQNFDLPVGRRVESRSIGGYSS